MKFCPKGPRVPLMVAPAAVVYTPFSPLGPQVEVPGATCDSLTHAEAKRRIPGVGFKRGEKVMPLRAYITE